jgi:N-acetylmuramoyl-L-alanine amidase
VAAAVVVVILGAAVAASAYVAHERRVEVPRLAGRPFTAAEEVLGKLGLKAVMAGHQVSPDVPPGRVISQDPQEGTRVDPGPEVRLIVSAGPQTLSLPDVVGQELRYAREQLLALGLTIEVVTAPSEATGTVVLATYPAPGATVSAGDTVKLTVPGATPSTNALLPYELEGITVVIDPTPMSATDEVDVTMDIARRLRALLEASGAKTAVTRTATDTAPTPTVRLERAVQSHADMLIGIDVGRGGVPGLTVLRPSGGASGAAADRSLLLAQTITRAARLPALLVNEPGASTDTVLTGFPASGVRVVVCDLATEADRVRANDPEWADQVARAIYRGIGDALAPR